jgi:hypothetical protein
MDETTSRPRRTPGAGRLYEARGGLWRGAHNHWSIRACLLAFSLLGCSSTTATPLPTSAPQGSSTIVPATPATPAPSATADLSTPDETQRPLPRPTLTEPSDIAVALFNTPYAAEGVVSLLDVMGVAIYDSQGDLLKPGSDKGAGVLRLTEAEVYGLVAMTEADLELIGENGGPYPLAEMYTALAPYLPDGFTLDQMTAAYAQAYLDNPDSLAAGILRGQQINAETGLLRIQMWLLLIDGFGGAGTSLATSGLPARSGFIVEAVRVAQQFGQTLGVARQNLPALAVPPGWQAVEWAELLYRLPTLAYTIDFTQQLSRTLIQEGHGAPGAPVSFSASMGAPSPVISLVTDQVILPVAPTPGVEVEWRSSAESSWSKHGMFSTARAGVLGTLTGADVHGAELEYIPKQESADGVGTVLREDADISAWAGLRDLFTHAFDPDSVAALPLGLISGERPANGIKHASLEWHEASTGYQVFITWIDHYNGIPDQFRFVGLINKRESNVSGVDEYWTGEGTAEGSRPGWKACNAGVPVVPQGVAAAQFSAAVVGDKVTITAFTVGGALGSVDVWPAEINTSSFMDVGSGAVAFWESGSVPYLGPRPSGAPAQPPDSRARPSGLPPHPEDFCPHDWSEFLTVVRLDNP